MENNTINFCSLVKNQLSDTLYAIGGPNTEITPLTWSLYHFDVYFARQPYSEPLDLGNPDNFQYFLIHKNLFLKGRIRAHVFRLEESVEKFKLSKNNLYEDINEIATRLTDVEWNVIKDERFLAQNDKITITPYHLGIYQDEDLGIANIFA